MKIKKEIKLKNYKKCDGCFFLFKDYERYEVRCLNCIFSIEKYSKKGMEISEILMNESLLNQGNAILNIKRPQECIEKNGK